jgi:hypothetical protein
MNQNTEINLNFESPNLDDVKELKLLNEISPIY